MERFALAFVRDLFASPVVAPRDPPFGGSSELQDHPSVRGEGAWIAATNITGCPRREHRSLTLRGHDREERWHDAAGGDDEFAHTALSGLERGDESAI